QLKRKKKLLRQRLTWKPSVFQKSVVRKKRKQALKLLKRRQNNNPRYVDIMRIVARFFFVSLLALFAFGFYPNTSFADTAEQIAAHKADLQNQLNLLNQQIATQQQVLEQKESESNSLQRDIDIINAQIKKDLLSIKARDITIQTLTSDIADKNNTINSLDTKLGRELQSLAEILRKTNSIDTTTFIEFLLSNQSVSSF